MSTRRIPRGPFRSSGRLILGTGLLLLAALGLAARSAAGDESVRPNIVYIMADDLGIGDVGCYGQREIQTPNIDRLAREGTRFTRVYAGAAVCAPSRCVLMTGLHTGHCRVRDNSGVRTVVPAAEQGQKNRIPLEPGDVTIAEVLRPAGYATAIFGKWGMGEPGSTGVPSRQGFDQWLGFLNQDHAVDYYTPYLWDNETRLAIPENEGGKRGRYVHDLFTERALKFLDDNKDLPFFLYLPYTIPHLDHEVPDLGVYANKPWTKEERIYAAMVTRMDGDIGRVLERIRALGLAEKTLVFFCSDNGAPAFSEQSRFHSGSDFRGRKGTFYEGGVRVPMIARWPGKVPAGADSSRVWYFADVLPTLAEVAGAKVPSNLDGISVLPTLLGKPQDALADRFIYWESRSGQGARLGNWKVVRPAYGKPLELYDLSRDAGESRDLATERPEVLARLESLMKAAHVDSPDYPRSAPRKPRKKADSR
jgi:arylsulfatase A-like enzyme